MFSFVIMFISVLVLGSVLVVRFIHGVGLCPGARLFHCVGFCPEVGFVLGLL